jgi:hypothetical protein
MNTQKHKYIYIYIYIYTNIMHSVSQNCKNYKMNIMEMAIFYLLIFCCGGFKYIKPFSYRGFRYNAAWIMSPSTITY